jgi:FMN phosphatase YigB (HAD superfamily)
MALYGVGPNTKYILEKFTDYNIVGLMDNVRTGDTIFGKPILSLVQAKELGVRLIIIVARINNKMIIYRRIKEFCRENNIEIYYVDGEVITEVATATEKSFAEYEKINADELKKSISDADVVSFDIFDTLLMRRCLYPRDVFEVMERDCSKDCGKDFAQKRIKAELDLHSKGVVTKIYDIYKEMGGNYSVQTEIETEKKYLTPRNEMIEILKYSAEQGKDVFLTSDMYFPKEIIREFFEHFGIDVVKPENILVSCDCGCNKYGGLYDVLREKCGSDNILHIGDNTEADIISPQKIGIKTFYIPSAVKMLEDSYAGELLGSSGSLQSRLIIGEFVAHELNNPFLFSKTQGKFLINSAEQLAYSYISPLIVSFFRWMIKTAKEENINRILLCSRDGYIFKILYDKIKNKTDLPDMEYLYISRFQSILVNVFNEEDLLRSAEYPFAGSTEEMLRTRFKIEPLLRLEDEDDTDYILRNKAAVLESAEKYRNFYLKYIDSFHFDKDEKIGFFDFLAIGTCQKSFDDVTGIDSVGLYFAELISDPRLKPKRILSMFGAIDRFSSSFNFLKNQFVTENILSSYEPTLYYFDENEPVFFDERREESQIDDLKRIHEKIAEYADFLAFPASTPTEETVPAETPTGETAPSSTPTGNTAPADTPTEEIDGDVKNAVDFIIGLLSPNFSIINNIDFLKYDLHDEFVNRAFNFEM